MLKDRKILFIVSGVGLGNATRSASIIQQLSPLGYSVDVLSSGNGLDYFKHNTDLIDKVFQCRPLYYGKSKGRVSMVKTAVSLPHLLAVCARNMKLVLSILAERTYQAVVIDSDYTLFFLRKRLQIPVFAINNADVVVGECKKMAALPGRIRSQYLIEWLDSWFHRTFPDFVLSPSIDSHERDFGNIRHFGPFIRSGFAPRRKADAVKNILVMPSGSQFGFDTSFLETLPETESMSVSVLGADGVSTNRVRYHGRVWQACGHVNWADIMVINGGFSAISEATVLKKPSVVVPVECHAEQLVNALAFERRGLGLIASQDCIGEKLMELIRNYPMFVKAHEQLKVFSSGAFDAAKVIHEEILNWESNYPYGKR